MKVTVTGAQCECGNPQPHRKFKTADKRSSRGFFSIEKGRAILASILASGEIEQTTKEKSATLKELEACGLPATEAEALAIALTARLVHAAKGLRAEFESAEDRQREVAQAIVDGLFTAEDGEKILALAAEVNQ